MAAVAPALTGCTFMRTSPRQSSVCAVQFEAARDRHVRAAVGRSAAQRPPRGGDLWSGSMRFERDQEAAPAVNPGSTALGDETALSVSCHSVYVFSLSFGVQVGVSLSGVSPDSGGTSHEGDSDSARVDRPVRTACELAYRYTPAHRTRIRRALLRRTRVLTQNDLTCPTIESPRERVLGTCG